MVTVSILLLYKNIPKTYRLKPINMSFSGSRESGAGAGAALLKDCISLTDADRISETTITCGQILGWTEEPLLRCLEAKASLAMNKTT